MNIGYCFVGFTLLFSSIYMMFLKDETKFFKFMNTLDDSQKAIYKTVIEERLKIYLTGMFLGLSLAIMYQYYSKSKNVCVFLVLIFATKLIFYRAYPKSTYMLYHLIKRPNRCLTTLCIYENKLDVIGSGALFIYL